MITGLQKKKHAAIFPVKKILHSVRVLPYIPYRGEENLTHPTNDSSELYGNL